MAVMILTAVRDIHARAVEWALHRQGIDVEILMYSDFPQSLRISETIEGSSDEICVAHTHIGDICTQIESLWRRRLCSPIPREDLHPADFLIATKESTCVIESLDLAFDGAAKMAANTVRGHSLAKQKTVQLRAAVKVGMPIPSTLMSNDPNEIRRFSQAHGGEIIVKPFTSPTWKAEDKSYFTFTKKIPDSLLHDDDALGAAPAIYQRKIKKCKEVRGFFAGTSYIAVSLDSQRNDLGLDDWRRAGTRNIRVDPHVLPDEIIEQCLQVMSELEIVTGSFDFAVEEGGKYVFFEVNEQGQFLWMERHCPQLSVLDMFSKFLISSDKSFHYHDRQESRCCFEDFLASGVWQLIQNNEANKHVDIQFKPAYAE